MKNKPPKKIEFDESWIDWKQLKTLTNLSTEQLEFYKKNGITYENVFSLVRLNSKQSNSNGTLLSKADSVYSPLYSIVKERDNSQCTMCQSSDQRLTTETSFTATCFHPT